MKQKIQFVLCLLFGLIFINSGLNKFFNYMPMPKDLPEHMVNLMKSFMAIGWLLPLVATVEIIGGILCIIPKTRALGAIVIFPVMVGIMLTHIIDAPANLPIALIFLAIDLWIIVDNRKKYMAMIG